MLLLAVTLLSACSTARLEVRNQSASRLDDMTIQAGGRTASIGSIEPSAMKQSSICPRGELGALHVSFRADGKVFQRDHSIYFECHSLYNLRIVVSPSFETTVVLLPDGTYKPRTP